MVREVTRMLPRPQIWTRENPNRKILGIRHNHDPPLRRCVPNYLWIAELRAPNINYRIALILFKSVPAISGVRYLLRLRFRRV